MESVCIKKKQLPCFHIKQSLLSSVFLLKRMNFQNYNTRRYDEWNPSISINLHFIGIYQIYNLESLTNLKQFLQGFLILSILLKRWNFEFKLLKLWYFLWLVYLIMKLSNNFFLQLYSNKTFFFFFFLKILFYFCYYIFWIKVM